jgi:hypothetical protein
MDKATTINIRSFSETELCQRFESLARDERNLKSLFLVYLNEISQREIPFKRAHPSVFAYLVNEMKLSEPTAAKRISAARLAALDPRVYEFIDSGELSVSSAAVIYRNIDLVSDLTEVLEKARNKSVREVEEVIFEKKVLPRVTRDSVRIIGRVAKKSEATTPAPIEALFSADDVATSPPLQRACEVKETAVTPQELFVRILEDESDIQNPSVPDQNNKRYIPAAVKREVYHRDQGQCCYVDPKTGKKCGATRYLQYDHVQPFALGGSSVEAGNIRLLCRVHNKLASDVVFGKRDYVSLKKAQGS